MIQQYDSLPFLHRRLIEHVCTYEMTTPASVVGNCALPIKTIPVAKQRLYELINWGLLGQERLYDDQTYYYLTAFAVDLLKSTSWYDDRPLLHGPLSQSAKFRAYARLAFCYHSKEIRFRLTREMLRSVQPDLHQSSMQMDYYMALGSYGIAYGLLRIDPGDDGQWHRFIREIRHDILSHWHHPGFLELIQDEAFEVAVVTTTHTKCERMRRAFANNRKLRSIPLRIVAIHELIHLLAPSATAPEKRTEQSHNPARTCPTVARRRRRAKGRIHYPVARRLPDHRFRKAVSRR